MTVVEEPTSATPRFKSLRQIERPTMQHVQPDILVLNYLRRLAHNHEGSSLDPDCATINDRCESCLHILLPGPVAFSGTSCDRPLLPALNRILTISIHCFPLRLANTGQHTERLNDRY